MCNISDTTQNYRTDFPGLPNSQQYNNPFQQQAYPGYLPAYSTPRTPAAGGVPLSAASGHQHVLASTESVSTEPASTEPTQKPKRKPKKPVKQHDGGEGEDGHKDAKTMNKGDKGVQTKERKKQDWEARKELSRIRDEAANRAFEMASQYIPDGAARIAFQQQWDFVMELNREIDDNTEKYLPWYSSRLSLRKGDRAVPERKKED